ncbi:hypothetical protein EV645_3647 [Kribbella rubisoli]|uniref:Uncharacterized protein n=1 Tax=Kribbella rubisoli TaxID=3075929 RepID=A0A4Q7X1W7_9ACTN|nr:hypothetical protein [Kribbella rubisoli]RZU16099.1 hypothetical protein EV645_3647 [Kribbella rubisoli]
MTTSATSLAVSAGSSTGPRSGAHRVLHCYAHEHLAPKLLDLVAVQEAAARAAIERGFVLGALFVEEDSSGTAMQALIDAVSSQPGRTAIAVPHRGHLIPLGRPYEWQQFLEEITRHPLVFTGRTP